MNAVAAPLELAQVSHSYRRGVPLLEGLDLKLGRGVTGLVGANGAGKSTLMRIAAGSLPPSSGTVRVAGHDLYGRQERNPALSAVAWMPQTAAHPKGMSALDFVTYLTWMRGIERREARGRSVAALTEVQLGNYLDLRLGRLSGGMMRRVWLAQAIAATPEVLLLDEPSTGLDPRQRATMVELLSRRRDETILLSSHLLEDVVDLAERVIVLDEGRVVYDGAPPTSADRDWLLNFMPDRSQLG